MGEDEGVEFDEGLGDCGSWVVGQSERGSFRGVLFGYLQIEAH